MEEVYTTPPIFHISSLLDGPLARAIDLCVDNSTSFRLFNQQKLTIINQNSEMS
jgi:hypothetical protein